VKKRSAGLGERARGGDLARPEGCCVVLADVAVLAADADGLAMREDFVDEEEEEKTEEDASDSSSELDSSGGCCSVTSS
jgi:hypothetical protein